MNWELKRGKVEDSNDKEKVVVAVKASKEIPKTALVWALTHVVHPGDCITLLVVIPSQTSGRKLWSFPMFAGDCASGHRRSNSGTSPEQKSDITDSFSQMILQLHDVYDPNKINVKIKVVSGSPTGVVASEAKRAQAAWVILDKSHKGTLEKCFKKADVRKLRFDALRFMLLIISACRKLKHEEKHCMEELQCNIVVMKHSHPKVLRLNLVGSPKKGAEEARLSQSELNQSFEAFEQQPSKENDGMNSIRGPTVTPSSSPELFTATEVGTSSVSSSDPGASPFFISEINVKKVESFGTKESPDLDDSSSDTDSRTSTPFSSSLRFQRWMVEESSQRSNASWAQTSTTRACLEKFSRLDQEARFGLPNYRPDLNFSGSMREAVSLSRNAPLGPPPLCSICQHKAPVFGKPPKWFTYAELELATGGFSRANFLAEGGFGSVHRGVLSDGRTVAVKQHKLASSQGDQEFCSEVEVLSCAQHRNVVMLIGFCVEDRRRLLVYEYICNGSLDSHLYGHHGNPLEWPARQKIAVGAARGLRYLHEECRVGCIVHRDMRPNNILITHDFEPLVGDFGLARWQPDGEAGVETRVIGTLGYLAPEYAQSGQITEKADVYSFGVVLLELVTGRKAVDINRPKGQQCLSEWARPLLEKYAIDKLIDPRLANNYNEHEVYCMLHAASMCIRRDPHSRPRMSQVLRILEGDMVMDSSQMSTPRYDAGSQSGRIQREKQQQYQSYINPSAGEALEGCQLSGKEISLPGRLRLKTCDQEL